MTNKETVIDGGHSPEFGSPAFVPAAFKAEAGTALLRQSRGTNDSNQSYLIMNAHGLGQIVDTTGDQVQASVAITCQLQPNDATSDLNAVNSNNQKADLIFNSGSFQGDPMFTSSAQHPNVKKKMAEEDGQILVNDSKESQTSMRFLPLVDCSI